jgi:hypothetical protein
MKKLVIRFNDNCVLKFAWFPTKLENKLVWLVHYLKCGDKKISLHTFFKKIRKFEIEITANLKINKKGVP